MWIRGICRETRRLLPLSARSVNTAAAAYSPGCGAPPEHVSEYFRSLGEFSGNLSSDMDPLDFMTDEQLLQIFHCKKTEMSCIKQPHTFLNQLRDHNLISEIKYKKVMGSKTKHNREMRMYEMLNWFETKQPEHVKDFWKCLFKDHILQQYHVLRLLRKSLLDEKLPEKETTSSKKVEKAKVQKKEVAKEGAKKKKGEKGKEKEAAKKRRRNGKSDDEEEQPGCSSQPTPTKKKRLSKPTYRPSIKRHEDEDFWNWPIYKTQLPVVCGDKTGTLYRDKLAKGNKCILAEKCWLYPKDFEALGGKKSCKNWKTSIRCRSTTLHRLIQEGHLKCPNFKRRRARNS